MKDKLAFTSEVCEAIKADPRLAEQSFKQRSAMMDKYRFDNETVVITVNPAYEFSRINPDEVKIRVDTCSYNRNFRAVTYTAKRGGDLSKTLGNVFAKTLERSGEILARKEREAAAAAESVARQERIRQAIQTQLKDFKPRFLSGDNGVRAERGDVELLVSENVAGEFEVKVESLPYLTLAQAQRLADLIAEFEATKD